MSRSDAETLLAVQLDQAGIPYEREVRFAPPRRWRADFGVGWDDVAFRPQLLIEVDGGTWLPKGRHTTGSGFEADLEKLNAAALLGFRVLRFTPAQVNDGRALEVIRQALEQAA